MIIKKHKSADGKIVVAICDRELLGKKIKDGLKQLDLTSDFYYGEERSAEDCLEIINDADMLNIIGKKSITFALDHRLISRKNILYVSGIPFAQPCLR